MFTMIQTVVDMQLLLSKQVLDALIGNRLICVCIVKCTCTEFLFIRTYRKSLFTAIFTFYTIALMTKTVNIFYVHIRFSSFCFAF